GVVGLDEGLERLLDRRAPGGVWRRGWGGLGDGLRSRRLRWTRRLDVRRRRRWRRRRKADQAGTLGLADKFQAIDVKPRRGQRVLKSRGGERIFGSVDKARGIDLAQVRRGRVAGERARVLQVQGGSPGAAPGFSGGERSPAD